MLSSCEMRVVSASASTRQRADLGDEIIADSIGEGKSGMPKVAIVAKIEAAPGRMDQLISLLMAHRARCLKNEPGTLQLDVLAPREDDTRVLTYEVYRDDAAFNAHLNGASIARLREENAGMVAKFQVTKCALVE
jgi:(4S)-4-hydroxy-5-phosphonooxypentane-2,3-dione isomerase